MTVRVSTIKTTEEFQSLAGDWEDLLARSKNDLPFLLPQWNLTWWQAFQQRTRLVRDELHVKVARGANGELAGILPLMLTDRPGVGPFRARALEFLGVDPYITEQTGPIFDPARGAEVAAALGRDLLADDEWDWLDWQGLRCQTPFAVALADTLPMVWGESQPGNVLHLPASWDEFRAGLKRNIKESLRHCYNSLKRDGLTLSLEVAETPVDVDVGLDVFFRLHKMRATSPEGIQHPDRFEGPYRKQFLRRACARLAERGVTRVFTLNVDGAPVASRVGFALAETLYLYYSGFDPAWGKYSVMTTTVAEAIKYAIRSRLPRIHLSMGADTSKARWGPETSMFHHARSVRPRMRSRAALEAYTVLRGARDSPRFRRLLGLFVRQFD